MAPFIQDDFGCAPPTGGVMQAGISSDKTTPIAIVGMSCRFPGEASNVENLWKLCAGPGDAWTPIGKDRFNSEGFYHPDSNRAGTTNVRGAHFLSEDLAYFDAPFFNITREEAAAMDPQQRLILECSYEALENAGIPLDKIVGTDTAVFTGSFCRDWTDILNRDAEALPFYQATGTGQALLANRISYFYNLSGPSMSIDTACSSSLVAVHLACQSLRSGESKQAIVGGSNIILSHETMISMSRMRFLSPDGHSYAYDHRANGYARGEGAACVVLKPLDVAIQDGDTIRAIIRNTGTNQDGKTNGITLPSIAAQEALTKKVYDGAGLDPLQTSYVEAHGTGTAAGDPLEAQALSNVFTRGRPASEPLIVGSIKTKIGHLEGASGLAGLIKTVLMLENNLILPNGNFEKANERIPFEERKLKVLTDVQPWPTTGVRRASVCNYGYGGSNAHLIVDDASSYLARRGMRGAHWSTPSVTSISSYEANVKDVGKECKAARVFVLSAQSEASAKLLTQRLSDYLSERQYTLNQEAFDNLAYTLTNRRSHLPWKAAIAASSSQQLIERMQGDLKYTRSKKAPRIGFVFTGQGAQWHAMGRELIGAYPVFRDSMTRSGKYLKFLGAQWSLLDELSKSAEDSKVGLGYLSQPACTAVQVALVDLLKSWKIVPVSVTGHSSGEIAAAYAAGALSQKSAVAIAYFRGLAAPVIRQRYPNRRGAMLAVGLSREEAQKRISRLSRGRVVIACINSPSSITISGDEPAIEELLEILQSEGVFARKVKVDIAYHSHHMLCIAEDYLAALESIHPLESTSVEFYSSVTGGFLSTSELHPSYWVTNMVSPVKFSDSLHSLCRWNRGEPSDSGLKSAVDIIVEIGPSGALAGPIKQILQSDFDLRAASIKCFSVLARNQNAVNTSLQLVGEVFKLGYPVNLEAVNNPAGWDKPQALVDLPPYPWNHSEKYWAESREAREHRLRPTPRSDILGARVRNWIPYEPRWRNYVRPAELPWLRDHKIQGSMVYPAGGYIAMAIEAAREYAGQDGSPISGYRLRDIKIGHALVVPEGEIETMITLRPCEEASSASSSWNEFRVYSVSLSDSWTEHCRGFVCAQKEEAINEEDKVVYTNMISDAESACFNDVNIGKMYSDLDAAGLQYGPSFSLITHSRAASYRAISTLCTFDTAAIMSSNFEHPFVVHPCTVDGFIQSLFPSMIEVEGSLKGTMVPTSIADMFVSAKIPKQPGHGFQVYSKSEKLDSLERKGSVIAFNQGGDDSMISFDGLICSSLPSAQSKKPLGSSGLCFRTEWKTYEGLNQDESQISTSLVTNVDLSKYPQVQLVIGDLADGMSFTHLFEAFARLNTDITVSSVHDAQFRGMTSIVIDETLGNLLSSPSASQLQSLQSMLSNTSGTLWVTRGATTGTSNPDANLISGLARTVRLENDAKIVTLDLDPATAPGGESAARCIVNVFGKCFDPEYSSAESDNEFAERNGVILVPRVVEDEEINGSVASTNPWLKPDEQPFCQPNRPLLLEASSQTENLSFVDDTALHQDLADDDIEVEVKASEASGAGCSAPLKCRAHSGIVSAVGKNISHLRKGDKVVALSSKNLCNYVRVDAPMVQVIPEDVSFEVAVAFSHPYSAAYFCFFKAAHIEDGESVLLDAVDGLVSLALVKLCQMQGSEVSILVENREERIKLVQELDMSEQHFIIKGNSLAKKILGRTQNKGVDIVISASSSDEDLRQLAQCIAPFGRFVKLVSNDTISTTKLELGKLSDNIAFSCVNFDQVLQQRPLQASKCFAQAVSLVTSKSISLPTNFRTLPISSFKSAFQPSPPASLQSIIITTSPASIIPALPPLSSTPLFRPDASYLLIGGLGGLGRAIAYWMVSNGAKHLIFASRSGLSNATPAIHSFLSSLSSLGAAVSVHTCDISSQPQLTTLLSTVSQSMPPIRGIINAAMVIKNSFFAQTSHADYISSISPKVQGTWNLHHAFSQPSQPSLDFLLLLSSAIGTLGNPSQSAYASASTFLDAFASFRLEQNLPCTSLALGMISGVGYVAENASVRQGLEKLGFEGISEAELLGMLEFAVRNPMRKVGGGVVVSGLGAYRPSDGARRPGILEGRFEKYRETCLVHSAADLGGVAGGEGEESPAALRARIQGLVQAGERDGAERALVEGLLGYLAGLLMVGREELSAGRSMVEQGLDSLVAVQVRAWIAQVTGRGVGLLEVLGTESVGKLCGKLVEGMA